MTRKLNVITQLAASAAHMLVPAAPIDPEWKNFLHVLLAWVQMAVGIIAHGYTPEGNKL